MTDEFDHPPTGFHRTNPLQRRKGDPTVGTRRFRLDPPSTFGAIKENEVPDPDTHRYADGSPIIELGDSFHPHRLHFTPRQYALNVLTYFAFGVLTASSVAILLHWLGA
jgi:hypothetical protein